MCTADNICKMIEFLIDNIFVQLGGRLFCQVTGIPMGKSCAPLLPWLSAKEGGRGRPPKRLLLP